MDIEKNIEQYFVRKVKAAGGWPVKLACPGTAGMPDRMVLWPEGECQFVELKRPGGRPRPLQVSLMNRLHAIGFVAIVLSTREDVDLYVSINGGDAR